MKNILSKLVCFFFSLIVILSFLESGDVYATVYFEDDFSLGLSKWIVPHDGYSLDENEDPIVGEYGWRVLDNKLIGEAGYHERSYIYPDINYDFSSFELVAEVKNLNGVDQSFWFHLSDDRSDFYEINFRFDEPDWDQDHNNITLSKSVGGSYGRLVEVYGKSEGESVNSLDFDITQNEKHVIKIVFDSVQIKIYFDSVLVIDYTDNNFLSGGIIAFRNWGGDFYQGSYGRVLNEFDNLKISSVSGGNNSDTVVVVPGLGGSWNGEGLLTGSTSPSLEWKMPFFVRNVPLYT